MADGRLIGPADLAPYGPVGTLGEQATALLRQQRAGWPLLRAGYESLAGVKTHRFTVDGMPFDVQVNPARITSSSADVDPAAIRRRRCFLCHDHLPPHQRGIAFGDYLILCNPYPIFPAHYTVPHRSHVPQRIDGAFSVLLDLCRQLGDGFDLLYNGPRCGASAPDHLHFQVGSSGSLPLLQALRGASGPGLRRAEAAGGRSARVMEGMGVEVTAVDDGVRRWFQLDGEEAPLIERAFDVLLGVLGSGEKGEEEPMVNVLAFFRRQWTVLVFPRKAHRPSFYGVEGGMVISPAAVDMVGLIIAPREEDFVRLKPADIRRMFEDVCMGPDDFARVATELRRRLD